MPRLSAATKWESKLILEVTRSLLNGIILNDQMYRVTCTVHLSRNPNTGREYRAYVLTSVERLSDLMSH